MAAAEITPKYFNKQGSVLVVGRFLKATTADWIVLPYPGVQNIVAHLYTGAEEGTLTFGSAVVNNKGTAYTATTSSIVVDAGTLTRQTPYYVQAGATGGEIMLVTNETAKDNAASTLTVIRGCLGTTAAAASVADDVVLYIKNIVVFGAATTGYVDFSFFPMPAEPKAKLYE